MNPVVRDEGIVLRIEPQTNTSLRASWLLRRSGRVETLLKGAQRPKSYLRGQLDLFYSCEVVYYRHAHGTLHLVRECCLRSARTALRSDWAACGVASWLCGLVTKTLPPDAYAAHAHARLEAALDALAGGADPRSVQHWFELHWLGLLGLEPRLHRCAACGRAPSGEAGRGGLAFSAVRGGVLCAECRRAGDKTGPVFVLTPETHAQLRAWQRTEAPTPETLRGRPVQQAAEAEGLLGAFLLHHADIDLAGREILRSLL